MPLSSLTLLEVLVGVDGTFKVLTSFMELHVSVLKCRFYCGGEKNCMLPMPLVECGTVLYVTQNVYVNEDPSLWGSIILTVAFDGN